MSGKGWLTAARQAAVTRKAIFHALGLCWFRAYIALVALCIAVLVVNIVRLSI